MYQVWKAAFGRLLRLGGVAALGLLLAVPTNAVSQAQPPHTLEDAVARIESVHAGRVLSARAEQRGPDVVYHIRLLTPDREVRNFEIVGAEGARP
jgi:hypothetical protein